MNTRGRKSAASLTVVSSAPLVQRLAPPEYLTPGEKQLWLDVVNTKPADWFALDSAPVLVEYVRAVETCNLLAVPVASTMALGEPGDIEKILKVRDREAKRAADLATKLRLTQQSRYTPTAAATANKRAQGASKPWEFDQPR
jgi:hypothetical protein